MSERIDQPYQPPAGQPYGGPSAAPTRKKRRVFLWVFLAIQVLFVVWLIAGLTDSTDPCANETEFKDACQAGAQLGTGIGIALIFGLWLFVDLLLGVIYGVYRLAKRT